MKCSELIQNLNSFLDAEMPPGMHLEAREHVKTCHACSVVVETCRRTILVYRQQHLPLPNVLHSKVMNSIKATRPGTR